MDASTEISDENKTPFSHLLLTSETRDFLITPSGDQVNAKDVEGKTIGLYFSANWYPQCQNFTPVLANTYKQLKEQGANFEIVFVSSDEDLSSFDEYYRTMPWLAVPFSDLQCKKSLTERFQIEGIPSVIIIDPFGKLIQTDGVDLTYRFGVKAFPFTHERIADLEDEEKANHETQTLESLLSTHSRDYVISQKEQVPISQMVGKTVGLYFSALWCPPCQKFTEKLASVYHNLKEKKEDFEIVFISVDRGEEGYIECFGAMPWLALPYEEETGKTLLKYFNVQGIPTLIIIGPDGKTLTQEGRNLVNLHLETAYPFTQAKILWLQERLDEEAKSYPKSCNHIGHRHALILVSANSGGGPFICCECDEQGWGWAYQCIECGYEIHPKCVCEVGKYDLKEEHMRISDHSCACSNV